MNNFLSALSGRKGEIPTAVALILTVLLSRIKPLAERSFELGVLRLTTVEGVGLALSVILLAAAGWMYNSVFQTQRPDGTRNALYFLSYVLLSLSLSDAQHLFSTAGIGFLFALSLSSLHQATFQKRPEALVAVSGFLMALLIVFFPLAYPWLLILLLLLVLAEEFSLRMIGVFLVGALLVPYLWFSYTYLFSRPFLFLGWTGMLPWAEHEILGSFAPVSWVLGVGAMPVVAGIAIMLMNRPSRTRISRSTQRQMGVLLVSGICLLILAYSGSIPLRPRPQLVFLLPAMTYFAARGLERLLNARYSDLFLWLWLALVCGGAEWLNRRVFSSFLPL
jgi:hypothetical protein